MGAEVKRRTCPSWGYSWDDEGDDPPCIPGNLYAGESIADCPPERRVPGGFAQLKFEPTPEFGFDKLFEKDVEK